MSDKRFINIGWGCRDISPQSRVLIHGQFHARVSQSVETPLLATALALDDASDHVVMVSCDTCFFPEGMIAGVRKRVSEKLPGIDPEKIIASATHTHTAPVTVDNLWPLPAEEIIKPSDYAAFLVDQLVEAVVEAWNNRTQGGISRGFGHAVVGHNRKALYIDGHSKMYGNTASDDFDCIEGYEDHTVDMLFTWDADKKLSGMLLNVPCPAQVLEHEYYISADYWHYARAEIRKRTGRDIPVLTQCSAAGDQSPRSLVYKEQEAYMRRLRGTTQTEEIADEIANAVDRALSVADKDIDFQPEIVHKSLTLSLEKRKITEQEASEAEAEIRRQKQQKFEEYTKESTRIRLIGYHQDVVDRYESQNAEPELDIPVHVVKVGEVVFATNPFELFLDYGLRIKASSMAKQTFLVQLAARAEGPLAYLPTKRALQAAGYGAGPASSRVVVEGGTKLVEETISAINGMFNNEQRPG